MSDSGVRVSVAFGFQAVENEVLVADAKEINEGREEVRNGEI